MLRVIYKNHKGNCNRDYIYIYIYFSLKVLPMLLKMHAITFETWPSHANCKENKTVLLGLALSNALGVDHQNKNLLFRERQTGGTSRVLEKIIHLQSLFGRMSNLWVSLCLEMLKSQCLAWSIFASLASPHQSGRFTMPGLPPGLARIFNEDIASFSLASEVSLLCLSGFKIV